MTNFPFAFESEAKTCEKILLLRSVYKIKGTNGFMENGLGAITRHHLELIQPLVSNRFLAQFQHQKKALRELQTIRHF